MSRPEKHARYDRQLRLWAENGQQALEKTRIALIGANASGSEALKNLVLPGIGSYTIFDGKTVQPADIGSNFFVDLESVGQARAECVCGYLQELNTDVIGRFVDQEPANLIDQEPSQFSRDFDLVLVADLESEPLMKLSKVLWAARIPLVIVSSMGFLGYLRLALPEHTIIETHPESMVDLRLDVPWPELSALVDQMDLASMNDNEHTHVPYILLLLHYMKIWKGQHGGSTPVTYEEKKDFKALIKSGMRNNDEDNFDEAISNVWRACAPTKVPADVRAVFKDPAAQNLGPNSSDFWFLARAVSDFVDTENGGLLPVCGIVPDMKSDTTRYIALQQAYRSKAMSDVKKVRNILENHLNKHKRDSSQISDQAIEVFCKHSAFLKVIRYSSHEQEMIAPKNHGSSSALWNHDSLIWFYLAKLHADVYRTENGAFPDGLGHESTDNTNRYAFFRKKLVAMGHAEDETFKVAMELVEQAAQELSRAGSGELHNVASFMGGIAAQEVIKIVTQQYIPVNNTVIFDGIRSVSAIYEL